MPACMPGFSMRARVSAWRSTRQRKGYVHVVRGELEVNGKRLAAGDAAMLEDEAGITLADGKAAEVLVFDLAED